jgi:hypothetical protein
MHLVNRHRKFVLCRVSFFWWRMSIVLFVEFIDRAQVNLRHSNHREPSEAL